MPDENVIAKTTEYLDHDGLARDQNHLHTKSEATVLG